jgi:hypothetical protein
MPETGDSVGANKNADGSTPPVKLAASKVKLLLNHNSNDPLQYNSFLETYDNSVNATPSSPSR